MKKDNKNNSLIKDLFSDKLSSEGYKRLSKNSLIENQMKKHWNSYKNDPVLPDVGKNIWYKIERKCSPSPKRIVPSELWWVAACVALLILVGGVWMLENNTVEKSDQYIEIVANENKMYCLPDGSKVWMHAGSSIRFQEKFMQDRKVWLTGNSLFEVRKHANSRFRVYVENAFIDVKGTCFLVKQNGDNDNKITLFSGSIEFNVESTDHKILLKPMQEVVYNSDGSGVQLIDLSNISWKDGRYYFTNISLKRFIETINDMYKTDISLRTSPNAESAFTGSIRYDEPLDDVISKICFALNLKRGEEKGKVTIYN